MPKEYRERIIDEKPFRVVTLRPKRNTTNSDETLPDGVYSTVVTLEPGDAVLWFLRLDNFDAEPDSHMVNIVTTTGDPVTHSYAPFFSWEFQPPGQAYIDVFTGNMEYDSAGDELIVNDEIYILFDQFTDFTPGDYRLNFAPPETSRANIEAAFIVRGIDPDAQGEYFFGAYQSPVWVRFYDDMGGGFNNFPVSVPLTADRSLVYGIWGGWDFNSVPGTLIAQYTYIDPSFGDNNIQSMVSYLGSVTGSSLSVSAPSENGWSGSPAGTGYYLTAIVLNGASDASAEAVSFDA